jgi:hypothetical protein
MKRIVGLVAVSALLGCSGGETAPPSTCEASAAEGLAVSATDPYGGQPYALGYPPYAIDGCALAYVSVDGDLLLRDLAAGGETVLAPASESPRRPAIAGDLVAWEATEAGRAVVRVRASGAVSTVATTYDHAGEPRVAADKVIFTAWQGPSDKDDTDVLLYTPSTGKVSVIAGGPGQQRFADVSATHAAWTDFAEDPDGTFNDDDNDVADVVVLEFAAAESVPHKREGKQAFPMLGADGKLAYLDWGLVHPEPKFSGYTLRVGDVRGDGSGDQDVAAVSTLAPYVRPVARDTKLEWVSMSNGPMTLYRRGVDLAAPAEAVAPFEDASVFGPSASATITLVGASATGGGVTLRAFAR